MAIDAPRRPVVVEVEQAQLVGRLMDCQILATYAEQAMRAASCPEHAGPVDVALGAIARLLSILRAETGRYDREAAA